MSDPVPLTERIRAALAGRTELRLALLFGSRARGTATAQSDVDLAVLAPGLDSLALAADLGAALGAEVDVIDLAVASVPLLDEVLRDGRLVHEAEPGVYAAWLSRTLLQQETDRPGWRRVRDAWLGKLAERASW